MPRSPLNYFLNKLYSVLQEDEELQDVDCPVYLRANANPVYPFISLSIAQIIEQPLFYSYSWQVQFSASVFFRQNDPQQALIIADLIDRALNANSLNSQQYNVVSVQKQNALFHISSDCLTSKFINNYLSLIRFNE
jgi:hypothetical protein